MQEQYYTEKGCDLAEFQKICEQSLLPEEAPFAKVIEKNIPIYDATKLALQNPSQRQSIQGEWAWNLREGSGILVVQNAQPDHDATDAASAIFEEILQEEADSGGGAGDHFAKAGANGRIWNSLQKLCEKSPELFANYHGSEAIDAVAESWLGPAYQMTAQVNLVHPGGAAQQAHRDFHLGFMTADQAARFPAHVHWLSPIMTLQGALAHLDIEIEAGPTKLLPFSQNYQAGYMAWRRADFRDYFEANCVQLPLKKGDAIFFNPALFHAGGDNRTSDVRRLVNLLQISSAMGRAMENIDRVSICKMLYPTLLNSDLGDARKNASINAAAEGYAFPTNLDSDPPIGGLSPKTQADLMREGLAEEQSAADFNAALEALQKRQKA